MAEKVITMVLKVDLQCSRCYKNVKNILANFPKIRDQTYNEQVNTVTISVFCSNPEEIRDKLLSKGSKVIKTIKIEEPPNLIEPELEPEGYLVRVCLCGVPCYHGCGYNLPPPCCCCLCGGYGHVHRHAHCCCSSYNEEN